MLKILLDSPMESDGLTLVLDRTPDIFTVPKLFFKDYQAYGFFRSDELVGYGMICEKELFVNGKPQSIGYFANLYVKKEARKLGWLYRAAQPLFEDIMKKASIGFATTVKGNRATETMIGRRISKFPLMPHSASINYLLIKNILITFRKRKRSPYKIRTAQPEDLPIIAELLYAEYKNRLFGPIITEKSLRELIDTRPGFSIADFYLAEEEGKVIGVCSAWDLKHFRRLRIMSYRKMYKWVYVIYSLLGPLFGFPKLPKPGDPFREIVLNDFAVVDRDPGILQAILYRIYRDYRKKGYNMIQIGSYQDDPLLEATKPFFSQPLYSHIVVGTAEEDYLVKNNINIAYPFVDIALT